MPKTNERYGDKYGIVGAGGGKLPAYEESFVDSYEQMFYSNNHFNTCDFVTGKNRQFEDGYEYDNCNCDVIFMDWGDKMGLTEEEYLDLALGNQERRANDKIWDAESEIVTTLPKDYIPTQKELDELYEAWENGDLHFCDESITHDEENGIYLCDECGREGDDMVFIDTYVDNMRAESFSADEYGVPFHLWAKGDMRIVADYDHDFWDRDIEGWGWESDEEYEQFKNHVDEYGVYILRLEKWNPEVGVGWDYVDSVHGNVPNPFNTLIDIAREQFSEFGDFKE